MARALYGTQPGGRRRASWAKLLVIGAILFAAGIVLTSLLVAYYRHQVSQRVEVIYSLAEPPADAERAALTGPVAAALERRARAFRKDYIVSGLKVVSSGDGLIRVSYRVQGDPAEFARALMRPGLLELRLVEPYMAPAEGDQAPAPEGYEWKTLKTWQVEDKPSRPTLDEERLLLRIEPELTIRQVKSARATAGPGVYALDIEFQEADAKAFAELTERCISLRLAAVMDGEVLTAPEVDARIEGGKVRVRPFRDQKEVERVAKLLLCGALPAPIQITSIQTTSPARRRAASASAPSRPTETGP